VESIWGIKVLKHREGAKLGGIWKVRLVEGKTSTGGKRCLAHFEEILI